MDLYNLKLFLHLSGTLHFARTSRICNITPSALSRMIQRLENEVGGKLFERDNRSVKLTKTGMDFRNYAIDVIDRWERFCETKNRESGILSGEISLYCSVTACYSILPGIIDSFRKKYPKIHINLITGDAADAVKKILNNEADLAVAAKPDSLSPGLIFRVIIKTPLVFVAQKDIIEKEINWEKTPMIFPERSISRKRVEEWFRSKSIKPEIYAEVSGNEAILAMVRVGCGIGIVPKLVIEKSPLESELKILKTFPCLAPYSVGICTGKKRIKSPIVKAFWELSTEIKA